MLRRSHTLGEEVMESTKNAEDVTIFLPEAILDEQEVPVDAGGPVGFRGHGLRRIGGSSREDNLPAGSVLLPC